MLIERTVVCFDCKGEMAEAEDLPETERTECPQCGSRERAVHEVTAGFIRSSADLELDFEKNDGVAPGDAVESGDVELPQLVIVQREFSPDRNLYIEHVEDEATGVVLWHLESSLTDSSRDTSAAMRTRRV